jgi:hypothetical protein
MSGEFHEPPTSTLDSPCRSLNVTCPVVVSLWLCLHVFTSRRFRLATQSATTCSRWFFARGFLYTEDGGDTFLRNVGSQKIYMAPHPRRRHSSFLTLTKKSQCYNRWLVYVEIRPSLCHGTALAPQVLFSVCITPQLPQNMAFLSHYALHYNIRFIRIIRFILCVHVYVRACAINWFKLLFGAMIGPYNLY